MRPALWRCIEEIHTTYRYWYCTLLYIEERWQVACVARGRPSDLVAGAHAACMYGEGAFLGMLNTVS